MTLFKREIAQDCHDDTPVKEQIRQRREMTRKAIEEEATKPQAPRFKPEEWGL